MPLKEHRLTLRKHFYTIRKSAVHHVPADFFAWLLGAANVPFHMGARDCHAKQINLLDKFHRHWSVTNKKYIDHKGRERNV